MLRSRLEDLNNYDGTYKDMNRRDRETFLEKQAGLYGINLADHTPPETGSQEDPDWDSVEKKVLQYAGNDFHTNTALLNARQSAPKEEYKYVDKKWSEMTDDQRDGLQRSEHMANKEAGMITSPMYNNLPGAITSSAELYDADQFLKNAFSKYGLGDDDYYGNRDDRAAVSNYYVDLNRSNLLDDIATKQEEKPDVPEVAPIDPTVPIVLSEGAQKATDFVDNHSWLDNYERASKARNEGFPDKYKFEVGKALTGSGIATRGPGAVGTPGGFLS